MVNVGIIEGFPNQKPGTGVGWDQYEVSQDRLWTDGIGSCLAIALYEPETKLGALAHLTGMRDLRIVPEALFPENVVPTLVSPFGEYKKLEAVLAGEESLTCLKKEKMSDIVRRNLISLHIPIVGEDLGDFGSYRGRAVHLNCQTGEITVYRLPSLS